MNLWHQDYLVSYLQAALPILLTLAVLPAGLAPPFARFGLTADTALIAIYFWSTHRPTSLPPIVVLGIGVIADLFASYPLGIITLSYVLTSYMLIIRRRLLTLKPLGAFWPGFVMISCIILPGRWLVSAALIGEWGAVKPLLGEWVTTILLYPCLAIFFEWINRLRIRGL